MENTTNNKEIERKFLIKELPVLSNIEYHMIEQAYLCTSPIVRVRREDNSYYMTYKAKGFLEREEYNLPLDAQSYSHLSAKADGHVITKKRYLIPYSSYMIELDIFEGIFQGLILAEVEFRSTVEADAFVPPDWFGDEVTYDKRYHNSYLSMKGSSFYENS